MSSDKVTDKVYVGTDRRTLGIGDTVRRMPTNDPEDDEMQVGIVVARTFEDLPGEPMYQIRWADGVILAHFQYELRLVERAQSSSDTSYAKRLWELAHERYDTERAG